MLAACTNSLSGDGKSFADVVLAACVCATATPGPISVKQAAMTSAVLLEHLRVKEGIICAKLIPAAENNGKISGRKGDYRV
jgi:hypothetical protein